MASQSDDKAGLPFEPKGKKAKAKKAASANKDKATEAKNSVAKTAKAKKKKPEASDMSARARARADEILAGNRRKAKAKAEKGKPGKKKDDSGAIPEAVSRRMLRRMAILSGAPVALGVGIFFLSYYLQSREIVEFPPIAVLLVTMGCFGLGVLGLTYGVLSASWDTEPGGLVGLKEFKLNFGRVMDARRASKT